MPTCPIERTKAELRRTESIFVFPSTKLHDCPALDELALLFTSTLLRTVSTVLQSTLEHVFVQLPALDDCLLQSLLQCRTAGSHFSRPGRAFVATLDTCCQWLPRESVIV